MKGIGWFLSCIGLCVCMCVCFYHIRSVSCCFFFLLFVKCLQKSKGKFDFSFPPRPAATAQCGNSWMQTTAAAIHMRRMVRPLDSNSSLAHEWCFKNQIFECLMTFKSSTVSEIITNFVAWANPRSPFMSSIREFGRQSTRSLQSWVPLQHRGPSVLGGVQLWTGCSQRHGRLLPWQLRLTALHAGEPRVQTRVPRPVRGRRTSLDIAKYSQTRRDKNSFLFEQNLRTCVQGAFILYMRL